MLLRTVRVENFRSVLDSGEFPVEPGVTTLVGRNESGKTALLHALEACLPAASGRRFDVARDYPRKLAHDYRRRHADDPAPVVRLAFDLTPDEVAAVNAAVGFDLLPAFRFGVTFDYANQKRVRFTLDEAAFVRHLVGGAALTADARGAVGRADTLTDLLGALAALDLNAEGRAFADGVRERFPAAPGWDSPLEAMVWKRVEAVLPRFFYADEYTALPDKVNLADLARRSADPAALAAADRTALALLDLAGVRADELAGGGNYELVKSRLEGAANAVADTVFRYWTQGRALDVEFDVRGDPGDRAPFDSGPNLYVRVRDREDRSTVPFGSRSRGFVWFFSFVVGFEAVRRRPGELVLLLDEPGMSLHPLAQGDLLRYVDALAASHQVILTTHSPFLVRPDRLGGVRLVEDQPPRGTVVLAELGGASAATLHPVRAAVSAAAVGRLAGPGRTVYVPGVADLIYLTLAAAQLESAGKPGLSGLTLVPAGGLAEAARIAAVSGSADAVAVVHGADDAALPAGPKVIAVGRFRAPPSANKPSKLAPVDPAPLTVEDLFAPAAVCKLVSAALAGRLAKDVKEADLPPSDGGVLGRLAAALGGVPLDPAAVATAFAAGGGAFDKPTLARFEALLAACRG